MRQDIKIRIDSNPNLKRFLKENSYWYNHLNRNPNSIKYMEEEMKKRFNLTPEDKLKKMNNNITIVKEFLDILKKWKKNLQKMFFFDNIILEILKII